ncbi:hypothetical protein [Kribbella monticola]|uniref:hypothetical protein n=1 Tax=Kribbella monticola TaxID=2185285 RepID=UPI000DD317F1|nr:hypothetical protein [Kribbella monticola]
MGGRVDWPGRGPTWLGVPALVVAFVGLGVLIDIHTRQMTSRDLLANGVPTAADQVELDVYPNRGSPIVGDVLVTLRVDGMPRTVPLSDFDDENPHGVPEGMHPPAAGSRYSPPLAILYDPSDTTTVLAAADAELWLANRDTPRFASELIAGGSATTVLAMVLLTRDARRRGVSWWRWYSDPPPPPA